jgi:hypothetical protein
VLVLSPRDTIQSRAPVSAKGLREGLRDGAFCDTANPWMYTEN